LLKKIIDKGIFIHSKKSLLLRWPNGDSARLLRGPSSIPDGDAKENNIIIFPKNISSSKMNSDNF